jgi:alkylation response protein AidB-like acyl-CoA dehydrogenase
MKPDPLASTRRRRARDGERLPATNLLAAARDFVEQTVIPAADEWDRQQRMPRAVVEAIARAGYLGAAVPADLGGLGLDMLTYGLLHGEIGRGCSSLRSILTVHGMVARAIHRWGTAEQKARWLPPLARGEVLGAFAMSELGAGSDLGAIATEAVRKGDTLLLRGAKCWTTAGQIADLFLVFARLEGQPVAVLVEADRPGVRRRPRGDMLGVRASMLADLELRDCPVPHANVLARPGFGVSHVGGTALNDGRFTVAWGCVGVAQACLDASVAYAGERRQFGGFLREHQLVQRMITDMVVGLEAARLLCRQAARQAEERAPTAVVSTAMAKYLAAGTLARVARDAVQIQGAHGCSADSPVQRYLRDAKIMEIIEGSTEMQQVMIAQHANAYVEGDAGGAARRARPSRRWSALG